MAYNDGYFHNIQPYDKETVTRNIIYEIYSSDGKYFVQGAGALQIVWDVVLILLALDSVFVFLLKKQREINMLFKIIILGITLYLMLFEGRSKYLYMFLPIYICFAGVILSEVLQQFEILKSLYCEGEINGCAYR